MLELYRAMVGLSQQMLEAARVADWPLLIELGKQRDALEARLQGAPPGDAGGEPAKQLMAAVLAANSQIQQMVETQLASVSMCAGEDGASPP
jgi:hypothetical protein